MKRMIRMLALLLAVLMSLSTAALADVEDGQDVSGEPAAALEQSAPAGPDAVPGQSEAAQPVEVEPADAAEEAVEPEETVRLESQDGDDVVEAEPEEAPLVVEAGAEEGDADPLAEAAAEELPAEAFDDEDAPESEEEFEANAEEGVCEEELLPDGGDDNEALFDAWAAREMGLVTLEENRHVGLELTGANGGLYRRLVPFAQQVAAGSRTDTTLALTPASIGVAAAYSAKALGVSNAKNAKAANIAAAMNLNFKMVIDTLTADYPYEMYWFDKTRTFTLQYSYKVTTKTLKVTGMTVKMQVSPDFSAGAYTLSTARLDQVRNAQAQAKAIVAKYQSASDLNKLRGYVTEICNRVTYNSAALGQSIYGNPWQVIWVFDGNSSTNVVCEGYAKAFKYLCDLTAFTGNVYCYTATGNVSGRASGGHMWNIVTLPDGRNYLVDVTLTDSGASGLVLNPPTAVKTAGVSYTFGAGSNAITYTYDSASRSVYRAEVLALATTAYAGGGTMAVRSVSFSPAALGLVVGEKATLRPVYSPAGADPRRLTWSSSNTKVATVNASGVVTAKKKGTATITVRTYNELTARVTIKVGKKVKPKKVSLKGGTVEVGKTLQLRATLSPWNARSKLKWKSSNTGVARVSGSGLITPVSEGTATITVTTANKKKASVKVTVIDPYAPDEVRLWTGGYAISSGATVTLRAGRTIRITSATYLKGAQSARGVRWSTSNSGVATVSAAGQLITQGPGSCTITARASSRAALSFRVTVNPNKLDNIHPRPSAAAAKKVKGWGVLLKSVEVLGPNKLAVELYFVQGKLKKSSYLKNFSVTVSIPSGDGTLTLASGKASRYKVKAKKGALKTLRVVLSGSQVRDVSSLIMSNVPTASVSCSGTLK